MDVTPFQNVSGTINGLDVFDNEVKIGDGSIDVPSFSFGKYLSIDKPSLTFSGVDYKTDSGFAGTIGLKADSATLFGAGNPFSAKAGTLGGSYDVAGGKFDLTAGSIDLAFGQVLDASGTGVHLAVDTSRSPVGVTFDADTVALSSPDFPDAKGTLASLHVDDTGFSLGEGIVTAPAVHFGEALELDGLEIDAKDLKYSTSPAPSLSGTVGIGASTIALFPGQKNFTTSVSGFHASYDIASTALSLSATGSEIKVSDLLDITTGPISFVDQQGNIEIHVDSASATVPRLAGLTGSVQNLDITNEGFHVDSVSIGATGTVTLGVFSFTGLTVLGDGPRLQHDGRREASTGTSVSMPPRPI